MRGGALSCLNFQRPKQPRSSRPEWRRPGRQFCRKSCRVVSRTSPGRPGRARNRKADPGGIEAEEIVDLWNVVFPEDHNVWYNEETRPSISTRSWSATQTEGGPARSPYRNSPCPPRPSSTSTKTSPVPARSLRHADPLPRTNAAEQLLRSDLLRSAWMFAVGAMDAYFCDAYTDVVAATASWKSRQPAIVLPEWAYDIKIPIRAVLEEYDYANWRWRMAARKMMERENVISLSAIQTLFNKFFRKGHRFFRDLLDAWISRPDSEDLGVSASPGSLPGDERQ